MGEMIGTAAWDREFDRWLAPFWDALGDTRRRRWGPVYVRGLLGPGDRKSVEPMAARMAPDDYGQLHHFVCASCWAPEPLERVLVEKAQQLVGGPEAVLIVDDTALLKQGKRSVGVARQYAGAAGKTTNCQTLVSLTLAQGDGYPVWCPSGSRCGSSCPPSGPMIRTAAGRRACPRTGLPSGPSWTSPWTRSIG